MREVTPGLVPGTAAPAQRRFSTGETGDATILVMDVHSRHHQRTVEHEGKARHGTRLMARIRWPHRRDSAETHVVTGPVTGRLALRLPASAQSRPAIVRLDLAAFVVTS